MADDTNTTDAPATEPDTDTSATDALGDAGKKALESERREKRAAEKRANDLEARLKQFEDRDKSEAEKLADRAEKAERRAQELETRTMRLEVAAEKGLTAAQAKRLVGSTREELEADAAELLETFKVARSTPKADPSQGTGDKATSSKADEGLAQARKRFGPKVGQ